MKVKVTIDKAGRVLLPKVVRDELQLRTGDALELESEDRQVTLRPIPTPAPLRKERGVWVFHGLTQLSTADAEKLIRNAREE